MAEKPKRTVHVFTGIVQNERGEILMSKRRAETLPEADNCWELPGGKVDFGETAEQAIEREILEETGYRVRAMRLLPKTQMSIWNYPDYDQHTIIMCFVCELVDQKQVAFEDANVIAVKWIDPQEIRSLRLLLGTDEFIELYLTD